MAESKVGKINLQSNRKIQLTLEGNQSHEDWTFAKANTSYLTHKLHDYPARMIPQIAHRLIERYSAKHGRIFDPFCGSGTTLVEARLASRNAVGNDINPLAVLLAKVKSTPIDFIGANFSALEFLSKIQREHAKAKISGTLPEPPVHIYPNLLHWFKERVARDLEFLHDAIIQVEDRDVRDFLKIVLSDTIFKTSNIDHRSSRFIRTLHPEELTKFKPNVLEEFEKKLFDSVTRMEQYSRKLRELSVVDDVMITVQKGDARQVQFYQNEFDTAITSPPYGEEKNTIGYVRWSKLSVAWLRLDGQELRKTEKETLGAVVKKNVLDHIDELPSSTAVTVLKEVLRSDIERVKEALPFFFDYLKTLMEVHRVLKFGALYCIVIGDRSIRRKLLDMEKVTIELGTAAGFKHVQSFFRQIPMKLIPWNTPTGKTISRESIIIMQKNT